MKNRKQRDIPPVLDRYEAKYTIPLSMIAPLCDFIAPYCTADRYSALAHNGFYKINSLYFDTPEYLFLRNRILKTENRFNMRIRSYGDNPALPWFLEIKQRTGDVIRKYRAKVYETNLEPYLKNPEVLLPEHSRDHDTINLFKRTLHRYNAGPVVLVQYRRKAFISDYEEYARVTFDYALHAMAQNNYTPLPDPDLMRPCDYETTFDPGCSVILELKCYASHVPLWMVDLVRCFELNRRGFSKYATSIGPIFESRSHAAINFREPSSVVASLFKE